MEGGAGAQIQSKFKFRNLSIKNQSWIGEEVDPEVQQAIESSPPTFGRSLPVSLSIKEDTPRKEPKKMDRTPESSEEEEEEAIIVIPTKSKWGQLGIRAMYHPHSQCPSLLRSEDEYLTLKIEDNPKIQEQISYSETLRDANTNTHDKILEGMEREQSALLSLAHKEILPNKERQLIDTQQENSIAFERNMKDRQQITSFTKEAMKAHVMEDFLHLGEFIFQIETPNKPFTSSDEEFFDAEELDEEFVI